MIVLHEKIKILISLLFILLVFHASANPIIESLEKGIFDGVNVYRSSQNKKNLKFDPLISRVCRQHAQNMANGIVPFSHDGIKKRFNEICRTTRHVISGAENLSWNKGYKNPVKAAIEGWIESPSHHKAMVGDFEATGVGAAISADGRYYFNQFFVHLRS